jgi:hypothetical protein
MGSALRYLSAILQFTDGESGTGESDQRGERKKGSGLGRDIRPCREGGGSWIRADLGQAG